MDKVDYAQYRADIRFLLEALTQAQALLDIHSYKPRKQCSNKTATIDGLNRLLDETNRETQVEIRERHNL